jgi:hypothetical protein
MFDAAPHTLQRQWGAFTQLHYKGPVRRERRDWGRALPMVDSCRLGITLPGPHDHAINT